MYSSKNIHYSLGQVTRENHPPSPMFVADGVFYCWILSRCECPCRITVYGLSNYRLLNYQRYTTRIGLP